VREKLYRNLHQEVPYNARVMPVSFKTLTDGSWRFEQNIVVPTNHVSHPHTSCSHNSRAAWGPRHACLILCQTCAWVMHFGMYPEQYILVPWRILARWLLAYCAGHQDKACLSCMHVLVRVIQLKFGVDVSQPAAIIRVCACMSGSA